MTDGSGVESSSERPKRAPGAPSGFFDGRGGPSTFRGIGFQVLVQVESVLSEVVEHRHEYASSVVVRCEPRQVVEGGQLGYDLALGANPEGPWRSVEVKLSPAPDEVEELVARARGMAVTGAEAGTSIGLVCERHTPSSRALGRLVFHRQESANAEDFAARAAAAGDEREIALFTALGDDAWSAAAYLKAPVESPHHLLEANLRAIASALAPAGRGEALLDRLTSLILDGGQQRRTWALSVLIDELTGGGLLLPAPALPAPAEDATLLGVLVVLQVSPVPVSEGILAAAAGLDVGGLRDLLAEQVAVGAVHLADGAYLRVVRRSDLIPVEYGRDVIMETLRALTVDAAHRKAAAVGNTPIAFALADVARDWDDRVIGALFKAFDKPSKTFGDLLVIFELADMSMSAILRLMELDLTDDEKTLWASVRAQTYICGQGWVYQRVGQLEKAVDVMRSARALTDVYSDDENRAFTLKCEGRLARMQAEQELDEGARAELLTTSRDLLVEAYPAFDALLAQDSRFVSDRGECVSLLARTHAVTPDLVAAWEAVRRAEPLLAPVQRDKPYADLVILRAELYGVELLDATGSGGAAEDSARDRLRESLRELVVVVDSFNVESVIGLDLGASEIVARAELTAGVLHERLGEREEAFAAYQRAAALYDRLRYPGASDNAR